MGYQDDVSLSVGFAIDRAFSSRQIIGDNTPGLRGEALANAAQAIRDRQVARMPLVGCTPTE